MMLNRVVVFKLIVFNILPALTYAMPIRSQEEDKEITQFELASPPPHISRFDGVSAVAFSLDHRFAFIGGGDGELRIWNLERKVQEKHITWKTRTTARSIKLSNNGKLLALGFTLGSIQVLNIEGSRHLRLFYDEGLNFSGSLQFIDNDSKLLTARDKKVLILDLNAPAGQEPAVLLTTQYSISSVMFSSDEKVLVTGYGRSHWTKLQINNFISGVEKILNLNESIDCLRFSPDNRTLFFSKTKKLAKIDMAKIDMNDENFEQLEMDLGEYIYSMALSKDGKFILAGLLNGEAVIVDADTFDEIRRIKVGEDCICGVALSQSGSFALTGHESGRVCYFDLKTNDRLRALALFGNRVDSFFPNLSDDISRRVGSFLLGFGPVPGKSKD